MVWRLLGKDPQKAPESFHSTDADAAGAAGCRLVVTIAIGMLVEPVTGPTT